MNTIQLWMLKGKTSALMLGVGCSILSGGAGQMSINNFLEMNVAPVVAKKGMSKLQKKVVEGQLVLF